MSATKQRVKVCSRSCMCASRVCAQSRGASVQAAIITQSPHCLPVRRRQRRPSCAHPPVSKLATAAEAACGSRLIPYLAPLEAFPNLFKSRFTSRAKLPRRSASSALTPASNDAQPQNTCASITGEFPQNQAFACFTRDILDTLRTSDFSSDCSPDNTAR